MKIKFHRLLFYCDPYVLDLVGDNKKLEVYNVSSGIRAVSRLNIRVTEDAQYVCRWSTEAGAANDLTCTVSLITGRAPAMTH